MPPEDRNDVHHSKIMFIWLSANFNILSCVQQLLALEHSC